MLYHLIIPGLLWPASRTSSPAAGLDLPALERILGLGALETRPAQSLEACLAGLFRLETLPLPHAAIRRAGEGLAAPDERPVCLCADPVNLHFAREHLLLADASGLEIGDEEARQLVDGLNETFADIGYFEAAAPGRWYLWLAQQPQVCFAPLSEVAGRPMATFMPEGPEARAWHRLSNEVQVWLHNHPVNAARENTGLRPINSLWFWGGGDLPQALARPAEIVQAEGTLTRGLARLAGIEPQAACRLDDGASGDVLAVLETLHPPALYLNLDEWRSALAALERDWLIPALAGLKAGRISELRLTAPGERATVSTSLRSAGQWRFWKRPRSLDNLHESIA